MTRQLLSLGESVSHLILIDAPCPLRLQPTPTHLHDFFNSIGLLGTGKPSETPPWLLEHFGASVRALAAYQPTPLPKISGNVPVPKTLAISAKYGVAKNPGDPRPQTRDGEPNSVKWIMNNRTDFGGNGWEKLVSEENLSCESVNANHFTMMRMPAVSRAFTLSNPADRNQVDLFEAGKLTPVNR